MVCWTLPGSSLEGTVLVMQQLRALSAGAAEPSSAPNGNAEELQNLSLLNRSIALGMCRQICLPHLPL